MRAWAGVAVLFVAACGEAPAEKAAEPAEAAAAAPEPGEWELATEVTGFEKADTGKPRIDTPKGTKTSEKLCIGAGEQLPTELFTGAGYDCKYGDYYARGGTINLTLSCINTKMNEAVLMAVNGSFEGDSVTFDRNLRSQFATDGDVVIDTRVTGERIGDCVSAPADAK